MSCFPDATIVNIEANPLYEPSLKAIQEVLGGHYRIAAVTDAPGEMEMMASAHPYWNSVRPADDPYWSRINNLKSAATFKVPAMTLDSISKTLNLAPPYLLKLDVQGAETQALAGAREVLAETSVVICEADLDDFEPINRALVDAGFGLFDITCLEFIPDNTLGWFYPVYLSRRHDNLKQRSFWDEAYNAQVIKIQVERREAVLKHSAIMLEKLRAQRNGK
jgi:FkbM family methyltransferase